MPKTSINHLSNSCLIVLLALLLDWSGAPGYAEVALPEPTLSMPLWPEGAPGETASKPETRMPDRGDGIVRITNVSTPTISIYRAEGAKRPTPAALICPGGGYHHLAMNLTGTEIAEWLHSLGVTGVVLKYRVPGNRLGAFQDARRAMRLTRAHAHDWNIDPNRLGVIGFSAGGHLSARLSAGPDQGGIYEKVDRADDLSWRPDFTMLIYPAYLSRDAYRLPEEIEITKDAPSAFIVQTQDDPYGDSAIAYYLGLRRVGVFSELHVFPRGGHGYGIRPAPDINMDWRALAENWMRTIGILAKPEEDAKRQREH